MAGAKAAAAAAVRTRVFRGLLIGRPGSGKGSVAARVCRDFPVTYIASGDVIRREIRARSELGKKSQPHVESGRLVPDDVVFKLMSDELSLVADKPLLLDGFPRTVTQAKFLDQATGGQQLTSVMHLDVPLEVIVQRLTGRWVHMGSGRVYHYTFTPPKRMGFDDVTGEPLVQRSDDKPETIENRLKVHNQFVEPLVQFYREQRLLTDFYGKQTELLWPYIRLELSKHIKLKSLETVPWSRTVLP